MTPRRAAALIVAGYLLLGAVPASAQDASVEGGLEVRIWFDRGAEPTLDRGDRVRIYYRTSEDAYVAIFQIDTDGSVRLLHPRAPDESHYIRGGRDYRLLFPRSPYWFVDEDPGVGYYFVVASPEPFDFSDLDYSHYAAGWDLSRIGRRVYTDPYLAMDDYVANLIPDWETVGYGLDFATYYVGAVYEYPRFLCYECHGFRTYTAWNPYRYACTNFRVVVYDDPYYYPAYRYQGTRVVFATPLRSRPRFTFKERTTGEPSVPLVRTRPAPPRRSGMAPSSLLPPAVARPRSGASPRITGKESPGGVRTSTGRATPLARRPSRALRPRSPGRTPGGVSSRGRPGGRTPPRGGVTPSLTRPPAPGRPQLTRRGSTGSTTSRGRPSSGVRPPARTRSGSGTIARTPRRSGGSGVRPPRSSGIRPRMSRPSGSSARPSARPPARPPSAKPRRGSRPGGSKPPPHPPRRKPKRGGGGR